jgi:hypothetical protein
VRHPTASALLGRAASRSATAALARSTPRLAGGGLDMSRRDFWENMATADSRHRKSNEENSMVPDFQKENLANWKAGPRCVRVPQVDF